MRSRIFAGAVLLLTVTLTACTLMNMVNPPAKQRKTALDDFMHALRWQRYEEAASYFKREHRQAFLDRIEKVKADLNVTEVRLHKLDLFAEGRRAEVLLEIDYYLLPSAALKTLRVPQTWVYFEVGDSEASGFLITTPFPEFPREPSRGKGTLPP